MYAKTYSFFLNPFFSRDFRCLSEDATENDANETLRLWNDIMQSDGLDLEPVAPAPAPLPPPPPAPPVPINYVVVAKRGRQPDPEKEKEDRKEAHRRRMAGKRFGIAAFAARNLREAFHGVD